MGHLEGSIPCLSPGFRLLGASAGRQKEPMCEGQTPHGGLAPSLPAVSLEAATAFPLPARLKARFLPVLNPPPLPSPLSQNKDQELGGLFSEGVKGRIRPPFPEEHPPHHGLRSEETQESPVSAVCLWQCGRRWRRWPGLGGHCALKGNARLPGQGLSWLCTPCRGEGRGRPLWPPRGTLRAPQLPPATSLRALVSDPRPN